MQILHFPAPCAAGSQHVATFGGQNRAGVAQAAGETVP